MDNEKYKAALKWHVPVVTHEWVIDCFQKQKLLDIAAYLVEHGAESKASNSILIETPKPRESCQQSRSSKKLSNNFPPTTAKPAEKFKVPKQVTPLTPKNLTFGSDEDVTPIVQSQPMRASNGFGLTEVHDLDVSKTSTTSVETPPIYKNFSKAAARQLRMALDAEASDSPTDYSSMKIKLPRRNSTPEADAFRNLWQAMKDRFPYQQTRPDETPKASNDELLIRRLPKS